MLWQDEGVLESEASETAAARTEPPAAWPADEVRLKTVRALEQVVIEMESALMEIADRQSRASQILYDSYVKDQCAEVFMEHQGGHTIETDSVQTGSVHTDRVRAYIHTGPNNSPQTKKQTNKNKNKNTKTQQKQTKDNNKQKPTNHPGCYTHIPWFDGRCRAEEKRFRPEVLGP